MYLFTNNSARAGCNKRLIFKAEFNRTYFRDFLLQDKLPNQGLRTQSALLFTHRWRENNWVHTFPKGISAMWNAIISVILLHMDQQRQNDQQEPIYNSSVPIHDIALETFREQWTIETAGEKGSVRSVLAA